MTSTQITQDQLRAMLARMVVDNAGCRRISDAQRHLDAAVECCLTEGRIELGAAIGILNGMEVMGPFAVAQGLSALLEAMVDLNPGEYRRRIVEAG